jgi:hypothetical protein
LDKCSPLATKEYSGSSLATKAEEYSSLATNALEERSPPAAKALDKEWSLLLLLKLGKNGILSLDSEEHERLRGTSAVSKAAATIVGAVVSAFTVSLGVVPSSKFNPLN